VADYQGGGYLKFERLLKNSRGISYIQTLIIVFVCGFLFILIVSTISVGIQYSKVVVYTNSLVDNAKVYGEIDSVADTYSEMAVNTGLDTSKLAYSWSAQYFNESAGELAFKQPFSLTVTYSCQLPLFGGNGSIGIPVKYVGKGVSEVFWK
jgi:hypothetical protein